MDWKERVSNLLKDKQLTLQDVCDRYDSAAKRRGMTRVSKAGDVAEHTLTPGALSHWLKGRREPRISEFIALAEALKTSPEALLAGENLNTPAPKSSEIERAVKNVLSADPTLVSRLLSHSADMAQKQPKHKKTAKRGK
jgi:transcriptional regulator with XRE-family HTH domain